MKYAVTLWHDKNLHHNVKYREQIFGAGGEDWSGEILSIGNFATKDLFCDNSVELSIPYEQAINSNFIRLRIDDFKVIGNITHWEYINDNNTRIHYVVDAYSSAVASGRLEDLDGLCDRVNSYCVDHWRNLLPEPFSPSDIRQAAPDLTIQFTNFIDAVEGFQGGTTHLADPNVNFVLTVSPAIVDFLGVGAFNTPGTFTPEFKTRATLNFKGADFTRHYGGIFRGTPLLFGSIDAVKTFIKDILGGCGFLTRTGPEGYGGQDLQNNVSLAYVDSPGGAMVQTGDSDFNQQWEETATTTETYNLTESGGYAWNGTSWVSNSNRRTTGEIELETVVVHGQAPRGLEYCRPITSADIYNLYCLPKVFCRDNPDTFYDSQTISGFRNYADMGVIASELPDKAKLAAYPYCYTELVTANGDVLNVIPQQDYLTTLTVLDPNYTIRFRVAFFGGDTPRLMGMVKPARAGDNTYSMAEQWITIRSYPAITSALNDDLNAQQQRDYANTKQIGAAGANARIQARLNSPIAEAYRDGVGGGTSGSGFLNRVLSHSGATLRAQLQRGGVGQWLQENAPGGLADVISGKEGFFSNPGEAASSMMANSLQGQIISPAGSTVMGNDFLGQLQQLPVTAYNRGATDSELYSFARYLGKFGSAVSGILNPRTNIGLLFGGLCLPQPFEGRTFYKFLSLEIYEDIPRTWKDSIEALFLSGVWLIEN